MSLSVCQSCTVPIESKSSSSRSPWSGLLGASDTYETQDAVYVKVDIPGMSKTDVKVSITDGNLHVTGTRAKDMTISDVNFLHAERQYGHFSRMFKLPEYTDLSKVTATCDHGVLTVRVPKSVGAPATADEGALRVLSEEDEGDGTLNAEFAAVPISVFPTPTLGKLVIINSDTPIVEAVRTLAQYRILAAPVRDVTKRADAPWTEKYLGIVDMVSVVQYMLEKLEPSGKPPEDFDKEIGMVEEFKRTTVAEASRYAKFGPFVPIDYDRGNLLDAMLLCGQHAIRRVPVVKSPGGDVVNIITQSALVQTLSANMERFGSVCKKTLAQLGFASPARVFSVTSEDSLRTAFRLIKDYDVSAVPVFDSKTGAICGNVSARDVRLIATSNKIYKLLNMPLRVYLDVVSDGAVKSAITCSIDDTLEEVIKRLVRSRIHRIYVVDSQEHVIRVLSLRNVLRKFVKEPSGYFGHYFD